MVNKQKLIAEAIINGRKYSTETAKLICMEYNPFKPEKWGALYQKRTGEFFFVGSYYPTRWELALHSGKKEDNKMWDNMLERSRHSIMALTDDEAKMVVEEWCSVDEYIELFGEVEE